jgi:hypothetical protein
MLNGNLLDVFMLMNFGFDFHHNMEFKAKIVMKIVMNINNQLIGDR